MRDKTKLLVVELGGGIFTASAMHKHHTLPLLAPYLQCEEQSLRAFEHVL